MTKAPIRKVIVAGQDASAWLAANALSCAFSRSGLVVEVVELPSLLRPHDVFKTLPAQEALHRLLGIDEHEVLRACAGTYSLGQSLANFSGTQLPFLRPFGNHGLAMGDVPFHQLWLQARQAGLKVPFENFSLTAAAAKQARFFVAGNKHRVLGRSDYSYHLKASAYVEFLKTLALRRGVSVIPARHIEAVLDSESGDIRWLALADGRVVEGDLFIDATGAKSRLLSAALGGFRRDWSHWFPGDRMLTAAGDRMKRLPSYSQVRALHAGCLYFAPVQDMTSLTYVYDSAATKDDEALGDMSLVAGMTLTGAATVSPLVPGRQAVLWERNCIGIGEAAFVFDPIDNPDLHSIQLGLAHLVNLFPIDGDCAVERQEYNRIMGEAVERFRDFQIAHYKLNRLNDHAVWDRLREMAVPDELTTKIELFKARGKIQLCEEETFTADDWLSIFIGHGLEPRSYDPRADLLPLDEAIRHVQQLLAFIKEEVEAMTSHDAYIEMFAARGFA